MYVIIIYCLSDFIKVVTVDYEGMRWDGVRFCYCSGRFGVLIFFLSCVDAIMERGLSPY